MIIMASIGATMIMPIAPRFPVMTAIATEPAMTSAQTSAATIDQAIDEADAGAGTTRLAGRLRSSSTVSPRRSSVPSPSLVSPRRRSHSPRRQ